MPYIYNFIIECIIIMAVGATTHKCEGTKAKKVDLNF